MSAPVIQPIGMGLAGGAPEADIQPWQDRRFIKRIKCSESSRSATEENSPKTIFRAHSVLPLRGVNRACTGLILTTRSISRSWPLQAKPPAPYRSEHAGSGRAFPRRTYPQNKVIDHRHPRVPRSLARAPSSPPRVSATAPSASLAGRRKPDAWTEPGKAQPRRKLTL